ncbi:MAG: hypothetical protein ABSG31_14640 [Tepidisphaeraceae bacterium]
MRWRMLAIFGLGLLPAAAWADSATTQPSTNVAVAAFTVIGQPGQDWVGKAVQEGLVSELQKNNGLQASATSDATSSADWTMTGSVQIVDQQIRIDAKLVHTQDNTTKSLSATGALHDLFNIEDTLAEHAGRLLPATASVASSGSVPTLELVGPPIPHAGTYFDGDLKAALAVPDQFTDQENRYNYRPTPWGLFNCVGVGCGGCGAGGCGGGLAAPAAPVSSW